ncbi:MAG: cadmium-translocating P-type ATPase [Clostridium sp.]|nr:cadmium-translocating P-type ATPase [Clostridium sp.]
MKKECELQLDLEGLSCANCARKIEEQVDKIEGVKEISLNFTTTTLNVKLEKEVEEQQAIDEIERIVTSIEPHVKVKKKSSERALNKKVKLEVKPTLILGIIIYLVAVIGDFNKWIDISLFILSYLLIGGKVVLTALRNIMNGQIFDENFLMTVATIGAFATGEYPEAVAVMIFYEIGETIQGYAVNRSRNSISSLMDIRADYANLIIDGREKKVSPEEVEIKDIILIKPGERIPIDGIVLDGESYIDTSALTGESVPRRVQVNDKILSGGINISGILKVEVSKSFGESTVSRILDMVENASSKKANTEKFITKFAKVYTPIVVCIAVLIAIVPLFIIKEAIFSEWLYRALIFLVVSCPCALVVSIPLGLFAGIGRASKKGVLVKGSNYLEQLKDIDTIVFDKTGTLTEGIFAVTEINGEGIDNEKLLEITAKVESLSNHPIATSIVNAYDKQIDKQEIKDYEEIAGHGIRAKINNDRILAGNAKLMNKFNIPYKEVDVIGTVVYIAINDKYKGNIIISDKIKVNTKKSLDELKSVGVKNMVMLTGDNGRSAEKVAKRVGINKVYFELLPLDKIDKIEEIINGPNRKGRVAFVGDGVNDAPVLARADIGIAMGGIGSDAAIEAADVVLMKDDISAIVEAIKVSKKTNKILWQNIIFALSVKVIIMVLGVMGIANMWTAVFADVGVTIIAIINAIR